MTFGEMQQRVQSLLGVDTPVQDAGRWINDAIHSLERWFDWRHMLNLSTAVSFNTSGLGAIPDAKIKSIVRLLVDDEPLQQQPLKVFMQTITDDTITGDPDYFAIDDTYLRIYPYPDSAITGYLDYWGYSDELSVLSDTNWFTLYHPDVVVWGACAEGAIQKKDPNALEYVQLFEATRRGLRRSEALLDLTGSPQTVSGYGVV